MSIVKLENSGECQFVLVMIVFKKNKFMELDVQAMQIFFHVFKYHKIRWRPKPD